MLYKATVQQSAVVASVVRQLLPSTSNQIVSGQFTSKGKAIDHRQNDVQLKNITKQIAHCLLFICLIQFNIETIKDIITGE